MFDEEELNQLREDEDEWKGYVERKTVEKSRTSRGVFFSSITVSFILAVFMTTIMLSSMVTANLIGIGGLGGFSANITKIDNADDIAIYPSLGPTAACDSSVDFNEAPSPSGNLAIPQLRAEIKNLNIPTGEQLKLTKDIDLPNSFISDLQTFRVSITQSDPNGAVNINDAVLYLTGLKADNIQINDAQIREFYSDTASDSFYEGGNGLGVIDSGNREGEFAIKNRPGSTANAVIDSAEARAHFVAFDQLDIDNLQLETKYGTSGSPLDDVVSINHSVPCNSGSPNAATGDSGDPPS